MKADAVVRARVPAAVKDAAAAALAGAGLNISSAIRMTLVRVANEGRIPFATVAAPPGRAPKGGAPATARATRELTAPAAGDRVETGVVQFGDDWPGVFVRGDNAAYYAMLLKTVIESDDPASSNLFARLALTSLYDTMRAATIGPAADLMPSIDLKAIQ